MRSRFTRLAGLAAALTLVIAPLVATAPARAATPGFGTLTVKLVDDLGKPVIGYAVAISDTGVEQPLGPEGAGASTFTQEVPVGSYGLVVFGGWSGISCVGLTTCSFLTIVGGGADPVIAVPAAVITDQGAKTVTVTTKTPKLIGSGKVGSPLELSVPSSLTEFSSLYGGGFYGGFSTLPGVSWVAGGQAIPGAASAMTYTPGGSLNKKSVSAVVSYPTIVSYFIQTYFGFDATPAPFTTSAVKITKTEPRLTMLVPGKIKQGQRPKALIKLNSRGKPIGGLVQLKIKGKRTVNGLVRAGFAEIKLPALKPGTYKVTATYGGTDVYAPVSVTKKLVVKPKK